jgi:hypothetical protein
MGPVRESGIRLMEQALRRSVSKGSGMGDFSRADFIQSPVGQIPEVRVVCSFSETGKDGKCIPLAAIA